MKEEQVNVETEDAEENEGEAEEEEEEVDIEELEQQVRDIENVILYSESKRLPEEEVTRLMKAYLRKNFIQNQGYVLDNYPKTTKQVISKNSNVWYLNYVISRPQIYSVVEKQVVKDKKVKKVRAKARKEELNCL